MDQIVVPFFAGAGVPLKPRTNVKREIVKLVDDYRKLYVISKTSPRKQQKNFPDLLKDFKVSLDSAFLPVEEENLNEETRLLVESMRVRINHEMTSTITTTRESNNDNNNNNNNHRCCPSQLYGSESECRCSFV